MPTEDQTKQKNKKKKTDLVLKLEDFWPLCKQKKKTSENKQKENKTSGLSPLLVASCPVLHSSILLFLSCMELQAIRVLGLDNFN